MKKVWIVLACVMIMFAFAGCGKGEAVASVNGTDIYQENYVSYLENMMKIYEINSTSITTDQFASLKETVVNELVDQELIHQACAKLGCTPTKDEIDTYFDEKLAELYGSAEDGKKLMESYSLELDFFRAGYQASLEQQKIMDSLVPENTTTDADAQKIYDETPDTYNTRTVSHILIKPVSTSETPETDEEGNAVYTEEEWQTAYDEAIALIKQLDEGADFATLAQSNSDDSTASAGGAISGSFTYETSGYVQEFTDASFELKTVGEYTKEPVKTSFGYHIIKLDDILNGEDDIQSALDFIKEQTYQTERTEAYTEYIETLRSESTIEYFAYEEAADDALAGETEADPETTTEGSGAEEPDTTTEEGSGAAEPDAADEKTE